MSLLANSNAIEDAGYKIQRSLRFRSSASAYLSRTPASAGNRQTWTWSGWVKRGQLSVGRSIFVAETSFSQRLHFGFDPTDVISVYGEDGGVYVSGTTNAVFRDPSAFYHVVFAWDTTQATAANRVKLFINGVQTALTLTTTPAQNANGVINAAVSHFICAYPRATQYFDGYLAEVNFIDGQALTPSSFGQTDTLTGVWVPKKYTGTYGTNGFYLPFSDNTSATTLAYDKSGNGNNWTPNNISTTAGATYDSMTDVPTLTSATAANYCVLNPLATSSTATSLTNGNLTVTQTGNGNAQYFGTIQTSSNSYYYEMTVTTLVAGGDTYTGLGDFTSSSTVTYQANSVYRYDGTIYNGSGWSAYGASYTTGDVIGVAYDLTNNTITFYKNNVSQGQKTLLSGRTYAPVVYSSYSSSGNVLNANFGQRPFSYTPPTGFKALNTFNLPDPTIKKGSTGMNVVTYTGDGTNNRNITGVGFQPDLVWIKSRSNAYDHQLVDSVRGAGKELYSNLTLAETAINTVPAFVSDGFQVNGGTYAGTNGNGATFAGWCWKKGATPGFDIVTYTGTGSNQTINHSLGIAPKMMIMKDRTSGSRTVDQWPVYHSGAQISGADQILYLNSTAARATSSTVFNNTVPTSTQFTVGTWGGINYSGDSFIAYLFAEIAGFSKFGSYTGNGSSDGPFVYCGFRPKYVMVKTSTLANQPWYILDSARDIANYSTSAELYPNSSSAEVNSYKEIDLLSNGFKVRSTGTGMNSSGDTYIYAAFASNPFKFSNAA